MKTRDYTGVYVYARKSESETSHGLFDVKLDRLVSTSGNLQDVDRSSLVVAQQV
jgi:hypothetical protein